VANWLDFGQNIIVKTFILISTILFPLFCFGQNVKPPAVNKDFKSLAQKEVKALNARYENFFVHHQEKKRRRAKRKMGVAEVKKKRAETRKKQERARLWQIANRKPKKSDEEGRRLHEKWMREIAKIKEGQRKVFKKKQVYLSNMRNNAKKIPAAKDVGLEEY